MFFADELAIEYEHDKRGLIRNVSSNDFRRPVSPAKQGPGARDRNN